MENFMKITKEEGCEYVSKAERFTIDSLKDFVEKAIDKGLCFNGSDIEKNVQNLVIAIVNDYIEEVEHGES